MRSQGKKSELQKMYEEWPFFAATIDLIEMILAKADMRISGLYDDVLVDDAQGKKLGSELRQKFTDTVRAICEVSTAAGRDPAVLHGRLPLQG
jgi:phosphoenolpyruvate carboxylase